jgi:hypothetical protein
MKYHLVFCANCQSFSGSGSSRNSCSTIGISQPSQRDTPMNKKPSHSKIRRIWRIGFYINGCATVRNVALECEFLTEKRVHDY